MNEQNQSVLLEAFIEACRGDANAPIPDGLDPEMAAFVRRLMEHKSGSVSDDRQSRERIWSNALTAANAAPHAPVQPEGESVRFSLNGHHKNVEIKMQMIEAEPSMVLPIPAPMRLPRRAVSAPSVLTIAATLALVFVGLLAMLRLNNGDGDQYGAGMFQQSTPTNVSADASVETATPMAIATLVPFPTSSPLPFNGDGRPLPCEPTTLPTIVPPNWPSATPTPFGLDSATPVPFNAVAIDCLLPTPIPPCQVVITAEDGTRLRSKASAQATLITPLEFGQPLNVIGEETSRDDGLVWYLVEFQIDDIWVTGYVREDEVRTQVGSECPPPTPTPIPVTVEPPTPAPTSTPIDDLPPTPPPTSTPIPVTVEPPTPAPTSTPMDFPPMPAPTSTPRKLPSTPPPTSTPKKLPPTPPPTSTPMDFPPTPAPTSTPMDFPPTPAPTSTPMDFPPTPAPTSTPMDFPPTPAPTSTPMDFPPTPAPTSTLEDFLPTPPPTSTPRQ